MAFEGTTKSGRVGIFTGRHPDRDCVITVGDPLDGSTVFDLDISSFSAGLNNRGQIAFIARLADGRTGVYRADPSPGHHDASHCHAEPRRHPDGDQGGTR